MNLIGDEFQEPLSVKVDSENVFLPHALPIAHSTQGATFT